MSLREHVARAIYNAAFAPKNEVGSSRKMPSSGWCWDRSSEEMKQFAFMQPDAAILAIGQYNERNY